MLERRPFPPRRRPTGRLYIIFALALLAALPAQAGWNVRPDAPAEDFRAFHRRFSAAAYHYPRHGAAPLGLVGFEAYADVAVDQDFGDEPFVETVLDDEPTGDLLAFGRVGVRKGLPGRIDLGAAYGTALDGDVKLLSADLQWAFLEGGAVTPAVALRLTGSQTLDPGAYELDQYGAEILVSKGFAIVTPYIGGGFVYSKGTLDRTLLPDLEEDHTRGVIYAGLTLNLLLPKIHIEVEKAEVVQGAVRIGIGF